ncbi:elongation factor Ts [Myxococcota bacterium]|nr:elongation factor Ts [Myxococcota bacterium]
MAEISAAAVKTLRDRSGAGMMDCKRALTDADGDLEKATLLLRERGLAKAAKREGRAAAEGVVAMAVVGQFGALIELGCETDFVARTDDFQKLAHEIAALAAADPDLTSSEALGAAPLDGETVAGRVAAVAGTLGENVVLKRVARLEEPDGIVGGYVHAGGKLGVLVALRTRAAGDEIAALAKEVAMHVAAADPSPVSIDRSGVPSDLVARERELFAKQAAESGKPANVIEKIVDGRINKFFAEVALLEQAFVKDPDLTVQQRLAQVGKQLGTEIAVTGFVRFRLGADDHS